MATEEMTGGATPSMLAPAAGPERGTTIGRFIVLAPLGAGGMGVVVRAYDPWLDRKVAIKLLRPRLDDDDPSERRTALLVREAQAMARVAHRNVIAVHDVGTYEDQVFIAMEHIDGETLSSWLQAPRGWREIAARFAMAARGLAAAHAQGLVHRDFKPDNVLVARDGRVLVTDFGVAAIAGVAEGDGPRAIVGTPAYMAPEQRRGAAVDARADQYSLCVALERALGPGGGPRWLRRLVARGCAVAPAARFPSMTALAERLERAPVRPALVAASGAVVAALLGLVILRPGVSAAPCTGFEARLAGVWDAPVKAAVRAAFLATGRPAAADGHARVAATLDGYRREWLAMRRDACLATAVRREQSPALLDLRIGCLDRRLSAAGALTAMLAHADGEAAARAAKAALALEPIADCADVAALSAAVPPPRDPARRAWVKAIDGRLDQAAALQAAGRPRPAYAIAAQALAEAEVNGHLPLLARAATLHAGLRRAVGGSDIDAVASDAARAAAAAGDDLRLASLLTLLVSWRAEMGRTTEALALRPALLAAADRAGDDRARADARAALGTALVSARKAGEGEVELRAALALRERALGPDGVDVATTLWQLASALTAQRKLDDAEALLRRGLTIVERRFGPDNIELAGFLNELAEIADHRDDWTSARRSIERMRAVVDATYGEDSPRALVPRLNLAMIDAHAGRHVEALASYQSLEPRCREVYGAESPRYLSMRVRTAAELVALDRVAEARPIIDDAARVLERGAPDSPTLAYALALRGELLRGIDREPAEALLVQRRALAIREQSLPPGAVETLDSMAAVAECLVDLGAHAEAVAIAQRALALEGDDRVMSGVHARLELALTHARAAAQGSR